MKWFVGTSGFSYKEWLGSFYPEKLSAKRMLNFYAQHFRSVEMNSTFYRLPKTSTVEAWTGEVPPDFKIVLKAPQQITHRQRLKNSAESTKEFLELTAVLGKRAGPVLFQLPGFIKKDVPLLADFLAMLDGRCRAAFEFRHQSWFEDDAFAILKKHQAALCIADAENDLTIPFVSTAKWGYLRLRRTVYKKSELKTWAGRIAAQKWNEAFVFFKHDDIGRGPKMAGQLLALAESPPSPR